MLWIENGKRVEKYSGSRSLEEFKAFIEKKTGGQTKKPEDTSAQTDGHQEEIGVLQLSGGSFDHVTEKGVTIVKFYAPVII